MTVLIMGTSHSRLSLDQIISNFEWRKRVVLLIAKNDDLKLIRGVEYFFEKGACQNADRNLEVIHYFERSWLCIFVQPDMGIDYYREKLNYDKKKYGFNI